MVILPVAARGGEFDRAGLGGKAKKLPPIHPSEQLREEFMILLGLSSNALARALNVRPARIPAAAGGYQA